LSIEYELTGLAVITPILPLHRLVLIALSVLPVAVLRTSVVDALFGAAVRVSACPPDGRALLVDIVAHLTESSAVVDASFHLCVHHS
jgi:hypothetical protein